MGPWDPGTLGPWDPESGGRPTLELRLDAVALPMGAQWIMVSGENSAGRGPPLRRKLVDIVRSRPAHANFSGNRAKRIKRDDDMIIK